MASEGVGTRGVFEKFGGDTEDGSGKTEGGGAGGKGGDTDVVGDVEDGKDAGEGAGGEAEGAFLTGANIARGDVINSGARFFIEAARRLLDFFTEFFIIFF